MVQVFIAIKDNKIIAEFQTAQGIDGIKISMDGIEYDTIEEVIDHDGIPMTNRDRREFDKNHKLRPLADRIRDELVLVPKGHIVDGEEIRLMTLGELVDAGIIECPGRSKIVDNKFAPMSDEEIISSGQATKKQLDDEKQMVVDEELILSEMRSIAIERLGGKLKVVKK